uniref:ATP synthase F0 subunit 8 n=1 Tax=Nephelomys childi TaxID=2964401 RepID=UPI00315D678C
MPQLDTSTWFITTLASSTTLFTIMQLKIISQNFMPNPTTKTIEKTTMKAPWELKWTKIYLPHSLPLQ